MTAAPLSGDTPSPLLQGGMDGCWSPHSQVGRGALGQLRPVPLQRDDESVFWGSRGSGSLSPKSGVPVRSSQPEFRLRGQRALGGPGRAQSGHAVPPRAPSWLDSAPGVRGAPRTPGGEARRGAVPPSSRIVPLPSLLPWGADSVGSRPPGLPGPRSGEGGAGRPLPGPPGAPQPPPRAPPATVLMRAAQPL